MSQDSLLLNSGIGFLVRIAGYALGFAAQLVTARVLSDAGFGDFWYVVTWVTTLSMAGVMGFDLATVRFVPKYASQNEWGLLSGFLSERKRTVATLSIVIGVAMLAFAALVGDRVSPELRITLALGGVAVPLASYAKVLESSLRAIGQVRVAQLPISVVRPGIFILAVLLGASALSRMTAPITMTAYVASLFAAHAVLVAMWRRSLTRLAPSSEPDRAEKAAWHSAARSMVLTAGFTLVLFQADILLSGLLIGTTEAGRYVVASKIANLSVFALMALNFVAGPMISHAWSKNEQREVQRVVTMSIRWSTIASVFFTSALIAGGRPLLHIFGESFVSAYPVLVVLLAGQLVNALTGPVTLLLNLTGHHAIVSRSLAVAAVSNIALNVTLIPLYGLVGAAIATASTNTAINLYLMLAVKRRLGVTTVQTLFRRPRGSESAARSDGDDGVP